MKKTFGMELTKETRKNKAEIIRYFRDRASESLGEIRLEYGNTQYKSQANAINKKLHQAKNHLTAALAQQAEKEKWSSNEKLESILTITYANYTRR